MVKTNLKVRNSQGETMGIPRSSEKRRITDDDIQNYVVKRAMKVAKGKFVWRKKIERDIVEGVALDEVMALKKKKKQRSEEIEKMKKSREKRAIEKAEREEQVAILGRERSRSEWRELQKREDEFVLHQTKTRAALRLQEGRGKSIDKLIALLDGYHHSHAADLDLIDDPCGVFKGLSCAELASLRDEINTQVGLDSGNPIHADYWDALLLVCEWELNEARRRKDMVQVPGIHPSTDSCVNDILQGKNHKELMLLQLQIECAMRSGEAMVDLVVEFWESILGRILVYKAKSRVREICPLSKPHGHPKEDEDASAIIGSSEAVEDVVEYATPTPEPSVLQKPKYLNHVYSRYEWNKYNRCHYDHENPPPKVVQGYKFNLFYPDLVDKSIAPVYFKEEEYGGRTCIIRFHAGPPYQDVAFRVVNGEWDNKSCKTTFDGQTLRLYFNFKRFNYKR